MPLWRGGPNTRGRYHGGRRPSSDDSLHSPTVIPPSALEKPSIMKRYHCRRTCSHTSPRRSPTMVTLYNTRFVECENCRHLTVVGLHDTGPSTLPIVLLTPPASKAADMAHLCVPQNLALGICRGFVPDTQVCGTYRREDLVNATITSSVEETGMIEKKLSKYSSVAGVLSTQHRPQRSEASESGLGK